MSEGFRRLKSLYQRYEELDAEARAGFLEDAARAEPEIAEELLELIARDDAQTWLQEVEDRIAPLRRAVARDAPQPEAAAATETAVTEEVAPPTSSSTLVGSTVGTIRVEKLIGEGGMGEVYRGWDEALRRRVALKLIRPEIHASDEARARFVREARLLSQLDHPNICRVYGLLDTEVGQCLVLEYLDGKTLRELLAQLDESQKLGIAESMVDALAAAHERGIVHRDLKPENFMLLEGDVLKVLDFGIARAVEDAATSPAVDGASATQLDRATTLELGEFELPPPGTVLTRIGSTLGTLSYMSPEQARGEPVTTASDMYSLGLVLQELWTGEGPYSGDSARQVLERARAAETQPVRGAPAEIANLVHELQSERPELRPSAPAAAHALAQYREKPLRRRRFALAAAASLLVVLSLSAAAWWGTRTQAAPLIEPEQRGRTLLLPIANATAQPELEWVERGLWAMILQTLDDTEGIEPVSSEAVDRLMDEGLGDEIDSLSLDRLRQLNRATGAELTIHSVLHDARSGYRLEVRAMNATGSNSQWSLEGEEPTELARDLGASVIRRLRPDAEFRDLYDRFSADPLVNRLYAGGIDQLRTDGADEAKAYFEVALDMDPGLDWARVRLATAHLELAEFDRARELNAEALDRATETEDFQLEIAALRGAANVAYQQGAMEDAKALAERVLVESRAASYVEEEASALMTLGDIERAAGKFDAAEEHYQEALALRRSLGDLMAEAHSLHTLGALAEERGESVSAEDLLRQAEALETEQGFRYLGGMTNNSLGILYNRRGELVRAREHFDRALALYEEVGAKQRMAHTLSNLATAWMRDQEWQQAFEVSSRAMQLLPAIDSRTTRGFLSYNHAYLSILVEDLEQAASSLEVATAHYGENDPDILIVSAILADKQGNPDLAVERARRAKEASGPSWDDEREGHLRAFEQRASSQPN